MGKGYVYSTHSTDLEYVEYSKPADANVLPTVVRRVRIKGGAGVADKRLVTPGGVVTEVSDEDLAFLHTNAEFLKHMKAGFVTVEGTRFDPDHVGADMRHGDGSQPLTPESFAAEGATVGKAGINLGGKARAA